MTLAYSNLVNEPFILKVRAVAQTLGINPNWLMQVMYSESRLKPQAVNKYSGATGLIQFMPATAAALGTSTAALLAMDGIRQMDYVYRYFLPYKGRINSYYDLYLCTFFPAAIGKPDEWIFQTSKISASTIAAQNPAININKDGKITIAEFKEYVRKSVLPQYRNLIFFNPLLLILFITVTLFLFTL